MKSRNKELVQFIACNFNDLVVTVEAYSYPIVVQFRHEMTEISKKQCTFLCDI